ncbi:MAG: hypothetical protein FJ279_33810, partial [Planctomycetes bacterium]|nr:hypothetical protein [Planctomycetota bacterium]
MSRLHLQERRPRGAAFHSRRFPAAQHRRQVWKPALRRTNREDLSASPTLSLARLTWLAVLLALAGTCFGQGKPFDLKELKDLGITADKCSVAGDTITAEGDAKVTLGKSMLRADKLVAKRNNELKPLPFETIIATGNVEVTHEKHVVKARDAKYDARTGIIDASGVTAKLTLKKGEFNLSADKVSGNILFQDI